MPIINTKKDKSNPSEVSEAYEIMAPRWARIDAVLGGTETMRAAGELYLPKHSEESHASYKERLARNTLLNMTEQILDTWVGKPFCEEIKLSDDMPEQVRNLLDDVDLQGNNLDVFCREWFRDGLAKGLSHVLVEMPRIDKTPDGKPRTLATDLQEGVRPYWVHVKPENVIFAYAETENGAEVLKQVRIIEEKTTLDGFLEVCTRRVRVLTPGHVDIYIETKQKRNGRTVFVLEEAYDTDLPIIPLVTFYSNRQDLMLSKPPLLDLADLNIAHWQSNSDQVAVLTVARFPILALSGAKKQDEVVIGPNSWLWSQEANSKFYYVEHQGNAIEAGRKHLQDLKDEMSSYGAEFLKKKPGSETATARALDSAESSSSLQAATIRFTDSINLALHFLSLWLGIEDAGTVTLNTEFGPEEDEATDLDALATARSNRDISRTTYLEGLRQRCVLPEDFDEEQNLLELEQEMQDMMAAMPAMTNIDPAQSPNDPAPPDKPSEKTPDKKAAK